MGKYDRLGTYLREQDRELIPMTFAEIERIVGTKLPSSQKHQAWWSNSTSNNVMTQVWLDAGYRTERVDVANKRLVFRRVSPKHRKHSGMAEETRSFESAEDSAAHHPLYGAMKGTFWVDPNWDLTKPALNPQEWDEIEKNTLAKFDRAFGK